MRKLLIAVLLAAPAAAHAGGFYGAGFHGHGAVVGPHFAAFLYALMAALGYWVLSRAVKEEAACARRAGKTVAWSLVVIGLLGLLCAVTMHAKRNACPSRCAGWQEAVPAEAGAEGKAQWQMKVEGGKAGSGEKTIKVMLKSDKPAAGK